MYFTLIIFNISSEGECNLKGKKFKRKDKERKEKSWSDYGLEPVTLDTKGVGVLGLRLALGSGLC